MQSELSSSKNQFVAGMKSSADKRRVPTRLEPLPHSSSPSHIPIPSNDSPTVSLPAKKKGKGRYRTVGIVRFDAYDDDDDDSTIASTASSRRQDRGRHVISNMEIIHRKQPSNTVSASPFQKSLKLFNDYESDIVDYERQNRLHLGRSDTHSIVASTTLSTVADELRRSYIREEQDFGSLALFIETRYLEMMNYEGAGNEPTRFKAAASIDMMLKLCQHLGRYSSLMKPILWELCNCIFVDFKSLLPRMEEHPQSVLKDLVGTSTYFEHCSELINRLEILQVEADMINQGIHMKDVVKKYQTVRLAFKHTDLFVRDGCFFLWKTHVARKRRARRTAMARALRYRFRRWRAYLANRAAIEQEELSNELDDKIHRLMQLNESMLNSAGTDEKNAADNKRTASDKKLLNGKSSKVLDSSEKDNQNKQSTSGKPPLPPSLVNMNKTASAILPQQHMSPQTSVRQLNVNDTSGNNSQNVSTSNISQSSPNLTPNVRSPRTEDNPSAIPVTSVQSTNPVDVVSAISTTPIPSNNAHPTWVPPTSFNESMMLAMGMTPANTGGQMVMPRGLEDGKPISFPDHLRIYSTLSATSADDTSSKRTSGGVTRQHSLSEAATPLHRRQFRPVVADASTQTIKEDRLRTSKARRRQSMIILHENDHPSQLPNNHAQESTLTTTSTAAHLDAVDDDDENDGDEQGDGMVTHNVGFASQSSSTSAKGKEASAAATSTNNLRKEASKTALSSDKVPGLNAIHQIHHQGGEDTQSEFEKDEFDVFEDSDEEVEKEWTDYKVILSPREYVPLTVETTCELIGYIYEQLFIEHQRHQAEHRRFLKRVAANAQRQTLVKSATGKPTRRRFDKLSFLAEPSLFHEKSILEVARKALLHRYHNKKISLDIFKNLLRSCLAYCKINRRIEVFAKLCNLISNAVEDIYATPYVPDQCVQFFFFILEVLTEDHPEETINIIVSQRVERDLLLKKLPKLFPHMEKEENEFRILVDKVIDMKIVVDDFRASVTSSGNASSMSWLSSAGKNRPLMVNFDDAMDLLLGYQELELQILHDSAANGSLVPIQRLKSTVVVTEDTVKSATNANGHNSNSNNNLSGSKKDAKGQQIYAGFQEHVAAHRIMEDPNES